MSNYSRRNFLKSALVGVGATVVSQGLTGCGPTSKNINYDGKNVNIPELKNEDFYKNGVFQPELAKKAYIAMFERMGYPKYPIFDTENFWAVDFGLGDFVNCGMGGIFWVNENEDGYFAHEIFLLPGQMIVEHAHVEVPESNVKAKVESWHVRHGSIYNFGEGTNNMSDFPGLEIAKTQQAYQTVFHVSKLKEGDISKVGRITSKHFMMGGPLGAIVSEYGTPHDNKGLRFTNEKASL